MKYCNHCGNQLLDEAVLCPKCGCMVADAPAAAPQKAPAPVDYSIAVENAYTTNWICIGLLGLATLLWYTFHIYVGAAIAFAAEIVAVIPNTKLNNLLKRNGLDAQEKKAIRADLKAENGAFKGSFILSAISLILLFIFLFTPELIAMFY